MEAQHLSPLSEGEWVLRQQDVGMAPDETPSDAILPRLPEDVGEFHHVRSRMKK
jgi:hypothetical protein